MGVEGIAYWAYFGGLAAGSALGLFLLITGWVRMSKNGDYWAETVQGRTPSALAHKKTAERGQRLNRRG